MAARVAVVSDPGAGRLWLLDAGPGRDLGPEAEERLAFAPDGIDLPAVLRAAGIDPEAITDLLLTHLHFDHASGAVRRNPDRQLEPAFPRALHHLHPDQRRRAAEPSPRDAGSFRPDHLAALLSAVRWNPVESEGPLGGAVSVRLAHGHTPGMLLPVVETDDGPVLFPSDLLPLWSHARPAWGMAFDLEPLRAAEEKRRLLHEAAAGGWRLISVHEPEVAWVRATPAEGPDSAPRLVPCEP